MAFAIPLIQLVSTALASTATVAGGVASTAGSAVSGIASSVLPTVAGGGIATPASANISGLTGTAAAGGSVSAGAAAPTLAAPAAAPVATSTGGLVPAADAAGAPTVLSGGGTVATPTSATVPALPGETTAAQAGLSGVQKATLALGAASIGLGVTQGVLSYQAGQDAKKARETQARGELGAAELSVGQKFREASRYLSRVRAVAGAGNVEFGGSPALLGQEAIGITTEDAATISRNAGRVSDMLRAEGRAASKAGKIGLGVGIGSGFVNAGNVALRVYG